LIAGLTNVRKVDGQEQADVEQRLPRLASKLEKIKVGLKENLAAGRFKYKDSLVEIYALMWKWKSKDILEERIENIAKMRGVALRDNANRFSGIVAICVHRDGDNRRTVSRWSKQLNDAFDKEIKPSRLREVL
jgi:hypothetical protein